MERIRNWHPRHAGTPLTAEGKSGGDAGKFKPAAADSIFKIRPAHWFSLPAAVVAAGLACLFSPVDHCRAAPGDLLRDGEATYIPPSFGSYGPDWVTPTVLAAAVDQEGTIWLGGNFLRGIGQKYGLGRMASDGSYLSESPPEVLPSMALLADGAAYMGGRYLSRRKRDGSSDSGFAPVYAGYPYSAALAVGPGGGVISGGMNFPETFLEKRGPKGVLDAAWNPVVPGLISVIAVTPEGGCFVGGDVMDGSPVPLARISPAGVVDTAFHPAPNGPVLSLAVQPDGKLLVAGGFTLMNGQPVKGLVRLLADGTTDPDFSPVLSVPAEGPRISGIFLQTDGAVLVTGNFTAVGDIVRPGMARLLANGTLDPSLGIPAPFASSPIRLLSSAPDGTLVGAVSTLKGIRVFRMENNTGTSSLTRPASDRIEWKRSGALPELSHTQFEFRVEGSTAWTLLGPGRRMNGAWYLDGAVPPAAGALRAVGWTSGNPGNLAVSQAVPVGTAVPVIEVTTAKAVYPSISDFGFVVPGMTGTCSFRLRNSGNGRMENIRLSLEGDFKDQFSIVQGPPETLEPDSSARVVLGFSPSAPGRTEVTLRIQSNAPDGPSLTVMFSGDRVSTLQGDFQDRQNPLWRVPAFDATGMTLGRLRMNYAPDDDAVLTLIHNVGSTPVTGTFNDLPQGAFVRMTPFDGYQAAYMFTIDYHGGDGNDVVLRRAWSGRLDRSFLASNNGNPGVTTGCRLRNGKLLIAGSFSQFNGLARNALVRLNRDGTTDFRFDAVLPQGCSVDFVSELEDGKILIGGESSGSGKNEVRRLLPNGASDSSFPTLTADLPILTIVPLTDGRILLGGDFRKINDMPAIRLAIVKADGAVDASFLPQVNTHVDGRVTCGMSLPDGKFLYAAGGVLKWINADGTPDSAFPDRSMPAPYAYCLARLPEGQFMVGHASGISRLNTNGKWDSALSPYNSGLSFKTITFFPLANGEVVVGDVPDSAVSFADGLAVKLQGICRLTPALSLDPSFDAKLSVTWTGLSIPMLCPQDNGKMLVGGNISSVAGEKRGELVQLQMEPATESLTVPDQTTVRWLRGGTSPETSDISFALYDATNGKWQPLGAGTSIAGGWELGGLALPADGTIRATARVGAGWRNNSYSFFDSFVSFGTVVPGLKATALPADTPAVSGGTLDFGPAAVGARRTLWLNLKNRGAGMLRISSPVLSGTAFAVSAPEETEIQAGGETELEITFTPATAQSAAAVLTIPSNDPAVAAFTLNLTGQGIVASALMAWRMEHFRTDESTGKAADQADPDGDGLPNLAEYALGLPPLAWDSSLKPRMSVAGDMLEIRFTAPEHRTDILYSAETATGADRDDWLPVADKGTAPEHVFRLPMAPGPRGFLRLRFTLR